jgi:hypothetical protein
MKPTHEATETITMKSRRRHHRADRSTPSEYQGEQQMERRCRVVDPETVANLSAAEIAGMSRRELVNVVRSGRLPNGSTRPDFFDRGTLERMAYLARLSCRNRDLSRIPR